MIRRVIAGNLVVEEVPPSPMGRAEVALLSLAGAGQACRLDAGDVVELRDELDEWLARYGYARPA